MFFWSTVAKARRASFVIGYLSAAAWLVNVSAGSIWPNLATAFGIVAALATATSLAAFSRLESLRDHAARPRELTRTQVKELGKRLKEVPKGSVRVDALLTSEEAVEFARQIRELISLAGWTATDDVVRGWIGNRDKPGVSFNVNVRDQHNAAALGLRDVLRSLGVLTEESVYREPAGAGADVLIYVGSKPPAE